MLALANDGDMACEHDACLLLTGLLRECAYRIREGAKAAGASAQATSAEGKSRLGIVGVAAKGTGAPR